VGLLVLICWRLAFGSSLLAFADAAQRFVILSEVRVPLCGMSAQSKDLCICFLLPNASVSHDPITRVLLIRAHPALELNLG
jgi:hypothetical protein